MGLLTDGFRNRNLILEGIKNKFLPNKDLKDIIKDIGGTK